MGRTWILKSRGKAGVVRGKWHLPCKLWLILVKWYNSIISLWCYEDIKCEDLFRRFVLLKKLQFLDLRVGQETRPPLEVDVQLSFRTKFGVGEIQTYGGRDVKTGPNPPHCHRNTLYIIFHNITNHFIFIIWSHKYSLLQITKQSTITSPYNFLHELNTLSLRSVPVFE